MLLAASLNPCSTHELEQNLDLQVRNEEKHPKIYE